MKKVFLSMALGLLSIPAFAQSQPATDKVSVFKVQGSDYDHAEKWVDSALGVVCYSIQQTGTSARAVTISCIKYSPAKL